jgi:hypothetical protein
MTRRAWISTTAAGAALFLVGKRAAASLSHSHGGAAVTVYRSPSCSCCGKWMDRMRERGFAVTERQMDDVTPMKRERHVPEELYSCHTAISGDFVFEGHVPPDLVERVLREKPKFLGLAVPGMPLSAPGMETGPGKYDVISFTRRGSTKIFATRS